MIIIGVTGPIGHGKTAFADALERLEPAHQHLECNKPIIEVADAWHGMLKEPFDPDDTDALNGWLKSLPAILLQLLGINCTYEQIKIDPKALTEHPIEYEKLLLHAANIQRDFTMARQHITDENKAAYRPILQWLGGYLTSRIDPGIWLNEIVRRVRLVQADGCKLCIVGGLRFPIDATILRQTNATIIKIYRPGYIQNDALDPTERERENIEIDSIIVNNGSLEELTTVARQLLEDLRSGRVQRQYQAGQ